jgi:hypothetical protein
LRQMLSHLLDLSQLVVELKYTNFQSFKRYTYENLKQQNQQPEL